MGSAVGSTRIRGQEPLRFGKSGSRALAVDPQIPGRMFRVAADVLPSGVCRYWMETVSMGGDHAFSVCRRDARRHEGHGRFGSGGAPQLAGAGAG